jgi:L-2,4-diaminobutyrate transaminase
MMGGMGRNLSALDRASLLHPFTSIADHLETGPRVMSEGDGLLLRDSEGREYLDAMSGLWCVNVGYGRTEIADAMAAQARRLPYYHSFASSGNEPAIECAARLLELAPPGMSKVFFGTSGSDANDTQLRLIWYYNHVRGRPEKRKIIARRGGYHGSSVATASLTGLAQLHDGFGLPLDGFLHVSRPHYYRDAAPGQSEAAFSAALARELDERILSEGPETVAAFFAEPVMGAGGVIPPPEGYFEAIQEVLRVHDVLLVADEVICGFGRLGTWWGSQRYDLAPDLMTLAKGLTSGYAPLSACLISERVWDGLRDGAEGRGPLAHGYTYSGHPVCTAAALANLEILEREKLVENSARMGERLHQRLRESLADHPHVGDVRGVGLIAGVELVADPSTREAFASERGVGALAHRLLLEEGLITRPLGGDTIALCPSLSIDAATVEDLIARLVRGLERLSSSL